MKIPIVPPPLAIVENDPPPPTMQVTETPPAPTELARAPSFKDKEYIATKDDDNHWQVVVSEKGELRPLVESEARQLASMFNEQGSNIVTLFCRNEKCKYKNSWIKRASEDIKKNVYYCEGCKQGMVK